MCIRELVVGVERRSIWEMLMSKSTRFGDHLNVGLEGKKSRMLRFKAMVSRFYLLN